METFLKMLVILLLVTSKSTLNAQLQHTTINTNPSNTPFPPPPLIFTDLPNIFTSQSSPNPEIGVNGRGIFTGTALASQQGPSVKLHSYPWLTFNKLVNDKEHSGRTLVYKEDTSFSLPSQTFALSSPTVPSIPRIPNPPQLPNIPALPAPVRQSRKTRSLIIPQISQIQGSPNVQIASAVPPNFLIANAVPPNVQIANVNPPNALFANAFPPNALIANALPPNLQQHFASYPFSYPIPYTIITQVIPVWPSFGIISQPAMPSVSGEASGEVIMIELTSTPKPEIITEGEFSGETEIQGPYPDTVKPDTEAEAEIQGPYPEPVVPEVSGEAIGEAMLSPYPAALPESGGDFSGAANMTGPYPAPAPTAVSGEASGGAMIEGPYPSAITPEVSSEMTGPYPAPAKPVVAGEASGGATAQGPYPAAIKPEKTPKVKVPKPAPAKPVERVVPNAGANKENQLPVLVKPPSEEQNESLKEFVTESKMPAKLVSGEGGKRKGPYLIPKKPTAGDDLAAIKTPVVPSARMEDRASYAALLRQVVYPEYVRQASGRVLRFN